MIAAEATINNCRYCLMCRHVAPIGVLTKNETLTPHGVALTIASQRRGLTEWNEETVNVVYSDPDGGNSRAHCVTDQPLPAAVAAVRAELTAQGLAPKSVYDVHEKLQRQHSPWGNAAPAPTTQQDREQGEVALFVGDEAPHLRPSALEAALKLLETAGIRPVLIGRGRSSGYLASSLGFPETAQAQARAHLEELAAASARQLLVLSPGDAFTFKQLYPERLDVTWPDVEVLEVVSLLDDARAAGRLGFARSDAAVPTAYVDPSHAVRMPGRFAAPRRLLSAVLPNEPLELFWRRERAHPVGSTSLQFARPDLADLLTKARLADAKSRGAERLVTEDPGTLFQLQRFAGEFGLEVRGLYELLAEHLAL